MADLSITAAQVLAGSDADIYDGIAGEAVTAGQALYIATANNRLYKADANFQSKANVKGIALEGAAAGQPVSVQTKGTITLGAGAAPPVGTVYWLSETAGGIAPFVDLDSGAMYGTYLGTAGANNTLILGIHVTNTLLAAFDSSP